MSEAINSASSNRRQAIHMAIGILLMFGFKYIPPFSTVTEYGMALIGIFLGLLYLWTTVGLFWPSLLGFVALALTDYGNITAVIKMSFGNDSIILMLISMFFLGAIASSGALEYLANWFLTRKAIQGKPWLMTYTFLFVTAILSIIGNFVLVFILWEVLYQLFNKVGIKKGDAYATLMIMSVSFLKLVAVSILPFNGFGLMALATFKASAGVSVDFVSYMMVSIPLLVGCVIGYGLMMQFVLRVDVSKLRDVTILDNQDIGGLTKRQKVLLIMMGLYLVGMCLPGIIPATSVLGAGIKSIGNCGIAIIGVVLLLVIKIDDKPLLNVPEASKSLSWDMIFLVAIATTISSVLTVPETGISEWFISVVGPIVQGKNSYILLLLIVIVTSVLTNIANNLVVIYSMITVVCTLMAQGVAFSAPTAIILIAFVGLAGLVLPGASMQGAMLHGNSDWLYTKDIYKYGCAVMLMTWVVCALIAIPIGMLVL